MLTGFRCHSAKKTVSWLSLDDISSQIQELRATEDVLWIDLQQPNDEELRLVYQEFQPVHPLSLEDITRERRDPLGRPHLPKVEEFPDYLFVIVNPLHPEYCEPASEGNARPRCPKITQLSAVLTHRRLITHHQLPLPAIQQLHSYLKRHSEQGDRGPDYLFHLILDAMVDEYAPVLDRLIDSLEALETQILKRPAKSLITRLLQFKRDVISLRKTLVHEREVLARLSRGEFAMIDERETVYYRNVYDHLVRSTELIENAREMTSDLMECHLSATSNRLNEIMKVLTMISTVVLPMTLVAGIYGMNFEHMPEIKWEHGYLWGLAIMLIAGLVPLVFFKWRRWF
jgi:magnesium transporter